MADPLSIAAGVVGLVATATKIIKTLSDLCASVSDAPESARAVIVAVETTKLSLGSIKDLFDTISTLAPERKALIRLDHIAVTCSQCVLTLSELEELVCKQLLKDGGSLFDRIRWSWGEKRVLSMLPRLESQKSCLALMISVLQCQSWADAFNNSSKLNKAVDTMLLDDENLAARIEQSGRELEMETQSIKSADSQSTTRPPEADVVASQSFAVDRHDHGQVSGQIQEFELLLETSRVYTRANPNEIDLMSVRGSTIRTVSSTLSEITMNHMSIISVYRLPITLNDINSIGAGLTFAAVITKNQTAQRSRLDRPPSKTLVTTASHHLKICVVGDSSSCKTKLLHRYITQKLPTETLESTVFEHYTALVRFRSVEFTMGIFDTAGAEDYDRLRPLSYPQTDVFIICARIPSLDMFENMGTKWIPEIQHHCPDTPFLIVGIVDQDLTTLNTSLENEEDDPAPRTIAEFSSLGSQLAEQHEKAWKYMDCNLLSQEDTNKVFEQAILLYMKQGTRKEKSSRFRTFGRRREKSYKPIDLEDIDEDDWSHTSGSRT